jgi:hypothetical protein
MNLTDAQIQTELAAQINAMNLPAPTLDADGNVNTVYMIDFPSNISITAPGGSHSCVAGGFCAYNGTTAIGGHSVPYGIFPAYDAGGCSNGCGTGANFFDNTTLNHSHVLLQVVTDTEIGLATAFDRPLAWYDPSNGQIGDACNQQVGMVAGYTVNKGWSQSLQQCIVTNPSISTTTTTSTTTTPTTTATTSTSTSSTTTTSTTTTLAGQTTTTVGSTTTTTMSGQNPPFGDSDTGFLPPARSALLKCENGIAKATAKLMSALVKCHIARASGKTTDDVGEDGCETAAVGKFIAKTKTVGCGSCTDLSAIAQTIQGVIDSNNGLAYCQ